MTMLFTNNQRQRRLRARRIALCLLAVMLADAVAPTAALALTGGPNQPEFKGFQPMGEQEMVDKFTGDFSYNIPLFEIGGYPINLSYAAGQSMEEEASWVGLGWTLNPGLVSRSVRGLPDDFNGDEIEEEFNQKDILDLALSRNFMLELAGKGASVSGESSNAGSGSGTNTSANTNGLLDKAKGKLGGSLGFSLVYTTGRGFGMATSMGVKVMGLSVTASYNPNSGLNLAGSASKSFSVAGGEIKAGVSSGYNSRSGLQSASLALSAKSTESTDIKTAGLGASVPLLDKSRTYFPHTRPQMSTKSFELSLSIGGDVAIFDAMTSASGSYSVTSIPNDFKHVSNEAFGMLYLENRTNEDLVDMNRDASSEAFYPGQKMLPTTSLMADYFSVEAHGTGGSYRAIRNDVGMSAEPSFNVLTSFGGDVGVQGTIGNMIKGGYDLAATTTTKTGGPWQIAQSPVHKYMKPPVNSLDENIVFKSSSEMQPVTSTYYDEVAGEASQPFGITGINSVAPNNYPYRRDYGADTLRREIRQNTFGTLTTDEAMKAALDIKIRDYHTQGSLAFNEIDRDENGRALHHISQIVNHNSDGSRHVFGIPAMNFTQKEVVFNAAGGAVTGQLIDYNPTDASNTNSNGMDHYFHSKTIPAYAHSYLLTAWLGADYVDISGNGVSDDDLGSAVRFNWTRHSDNAKWRMPINQNKAFFDKGSELYQADDKGSYTYGEKEVWYAHSIESKDEVAFFITDDRADAFSVLDEHGDPINPQTAQSSQKAQSLEVIKIYAKADFNANGTNATPIKTIRFYYDDYLCDGLPNAINGKLTLVSVSISHGNSTLGELSPYEFTYSTVNPDYDATKVDRWGGYKATNRNDQPFDRHPYVNEEGDNDLWASAWNLTEIKVPSGARITVQYEADRYGYVQDKKAQYMYEVVGMNEVPELQNATNRLYDVSLSSSVDKRFIILKRPESVNSSNVHKLIDGHLKDKIYFKFRVRMLSGKAASENNAYNFHMVRGYAKPNGIGICADNTDYMWVQIEAVDHNDLGEEISPILKAALDFMNMNHQDMIYGGINPDDDGVEKFAKNLGSVIDDLSALIFGPYHLMCAKSFAKNFDKPASFVRLHHPSGEKIGGGHRVKRIETSDEWHEMVGANTEHNSTFGKTYTYTLSDGYTSGVAQYEPDNGNDENPCRYPEYYEVGKEKSLRAKASVFQEGPFGESFYPPAVVGYSRVRVDDIHATDSKTAATYTINEFYTAKDFPVKTEHSPIQFMEDQDKPIWAYLGYGTTKRYSTTSQRHTIETNDMHGKLKKETVMAAPVGFAAELVRSTEYIYQQENGELVNTVKAVNRKGALTDMEFGVECETHFDSYETVEDHQNKEGEYNISTFNIIIQLGLPPIWLIANGEEKTYRTVSATVQNRKMGILKQVIETNPLFTATRTTEVWDGHTGEPLVSSLTTQYHSGDDHVDKLYTLEYPAYWTFEGKNMGHAYRNLGYMGDIGEIKEFLNHSQYNPKTDAEKNSLKEIIYRGLLDWLDENQNGALKGNVVQAGVFAEGDEVLSETDGQVYTAAEVLTISDLKGIMGDYGGNIADLGLNDEGGSTIGSGNSNGGVGDGSGTTTWPPQLLCGDIMITDVNVINCYNELIGLSASFNPTQNNLPLLDAMPVQILDFLQNPDHEGWYDLWNNANTQHLFQLSGQLVGDAGVNNFLTEVYGNTSKRTALKQLLECEPLLSCLEATVLNTYLIEALKALNDQPQRLNLVCAMAAHAGIHHVYKYFGADAECLEAVGNNAPCILSTSNPNLLFKKPQAFGGAECDMSMLCLSYAAMLQLPFADLALYPALTTSTDCANNDYLSFYNNNNESGLYEQSQCSDVMPYSIFNNNVSCENLHEPSENAGGDAPDPGTGPNGDNSEPPAYTYSQPSRDELVLFVDEAGVQTNLNGMRVKIIRSGRRNMLNAKTGKVERLNQNPLTDAVDANNTSTAVISASFSTITDDWATDFMDQGTTASVFNPFRTGHKGVFRTRKMYGPSGRRVYENGAHQSRNDGGLQNYVPFYITQMGPGQVLRRNSIAQSEHVDAISYWVLSEEFLFYSGSAGAVEAVNALDIYSAILAGRHNRVAAEGGNSRHRNLLYESFEQHEVTSGVKSIGQLTDLAYRGANSYGGSNMPTGALISTDAAHSGYSSLLLRGDETISGHALNTKPHTAWWEIPLATAEPSNDYDPVRYSANLYDNSHYRIPGFMPEKGKKMVLSAWMQSANTAYNNPAWVSTTFDPSEAIGTLKVEFYSGATLLSSSAEFVPAGRANDGWQRLEETFTIPANATSIKLIAKGGQFGMLLDDVRIAPDAASMKTYAYDATNLRLLATLDENNFGLFYKYQPDGSLAKLERETENGRLTVRESINRTAIP